MRAYERLLRYIAIDTGSGETATTTPSTPAQMLLAQQLSEELGMLGVSEVVLNAGGEGAQSRRNGCSICAVEVLNLARNTQQTPFETLQKPNDCLSKLLYMVGKKDLKIVIDLICVYIQYSGKLICFFVRYRMLIAFVHQDGCGYDANLFC